MNKERDCFSFTLFSQPLFYSLSAKDKRLMVNNYSLEVSVFNKQKFERKNMCLIEVVDSSLFFEHTLLYLCIITVR